MNCKTSVQEGKSHRRNERHLSIVEWAQNLSSQGFIQVAGGQDVAAKKASQEYTKPDLRDKLKKKIVASDKGGRPGQWSARKAQLLAQEYEKAGGGYAKPRSEAQKSLVKWTKEDWTTSTGEKAVQGAKTKRYLPKEAWKKLSKNEKEATERKKVEGSKRGSQFVANTKAAASARKKASKTAKPVSARSVAKR
jgi:hypothetical protein